MTLHFKSEDEFKKAFSEWEKKGKQLLAEPEHMSIEDLKKSTSPSETTTSSSSETPSDDQSSSSTPWPTPQPVVKALPENDEDIIFPYDDEYYPVHRRFSENNLYNQEIPRADWGRAFAERMAYKEALKYIDDIESFIKEQYPYCSDKATEQNMRLLQSMLENIKQNRRTMMHIDFLIEIWNQWDTMYARAIYLGQTRNVLSKTFMRINDMSEDEFWYECNNTDLSSYEWAIDVAPNPQPTIVERPVYVRTEPTWEEQYAERQRQREEEKRLARILKENQPDLGSIIGNTFDKHPLLSSLGVAATITKLFNN